MERLQDKSRRSSDYHPTIWPHQLIESIQSPYAHADKFNKRIRELKLEVKNMLSNASEDLPAMLELIDEIQRLGIAYHFREEIDDTLARVYSNGQFECLHGLNEAALCFRLLRQHGYNMSSVVLDEFRDEKGFKDYLSQDIKGLLSLYEATHLAMPEEKILEEAKEFTVGHLERLNENVDVNLVEQVKRSLEVPLYLSVPGLKARQYIDQVHEREKGIMRSCLLELAKLDFNVVQAIHQKEMKELSRWWQELGLVEELGFARDRLLETYFWINQSISEPKFSKCRMVLTKLACIFIVIDDFCDLFSSLEEAKLFTSAIKRMDLEAMETLPDNLKSCYKASYNFLNETACDILKDSGWDVKIFLEKEWIRFCESQLTEVEWLHNGITPSLKEYLENGYVSIGGPGFAVCAYYFFEENLTAESLNCLEKGFQVVYWYSMIVRLSDDLAPSAGEMQEEETFSSILCRMKDSGESYETSTKFIKDLLGNCWKEMNRAALESDLSRGFVDTIMNTARVGLALTHQGEDSFNSSDGITKDRIKSLFLEPIPME